MTSDKARLFFTAARTTSETAKLADSAPGEESIPPLVPSTACARSVTRCTQLTNV